MSLGLFYCAIFLGFVPLVFHKIKVKSIDPKTYYIVPFLILSFISSVYESVFTQILKINASFWFRLDCLLEFLVLVYYFYHLLKKRFWRFFIISLIIYGVLFLYLLTIWNSKEAIKTDSYLIMVEVLVVFCCALLWFRQLFDEVAASSLLQLPDFYYVSGFIFFLFGTLFLNLFGYYLFISLQHHLSIYWNLNILCNILLDVLIVLGIWKQQKN